MLKRAVSLRFFKKKLNLFLKSVLLFHFILVALYINF